MKNNIHFLLFENCKPILGKNESVIMDLQRSEYYTIPNILCEILDNDLRNLSVNKLKELYKNEYNIGIDKYFNYLEKEELGFFTNEPKLFPKINTDFNMPYKVFSSVISFSKKSNYSLKKIFLQLISLGCQLIQLRIFDKFDISKLEKLISFTKKSRINLIEIYLESKNYSEELLRMIMKTNLRVNIFVHTHNENKRINIFKNNDEFNLIFTKTVIKEDEKEKYSKKLLTCNTNFYLESRIFNVGLNKKICIDSNGDIKNYITHTKTFGNINDTDLKTVIELSDFKKKWLINNDKIEKCNECQFRYMCLSNSEIEFKNNKYYKKNYCEYYL